MHVAAFRDKTCEIYNDQTDKTFDLKTIIDKGILNVCNCTARCLYYFIMYSHGIFAMCICGAENERRASKKNIIEEMIQMIGAIYATSVDSVSLRLFPILFLHLDQRIYFSLSFFAPHKLSIQTRTMFVINIILPFILHRLLGNFSVYNFRSTTVWAFSDDPNTVININWNKNS